MAITQPHFIERSTNIEFIYLTDHGDYRLYKLIHKYGSTQAQRVAVNRFLEQYLQESFDTPNRRYPNVVQLCGTTMMAFFIRNTTLSMRNICGLLMARLEADESSKYICYLSVLREHRRKGLGTKLLNEFIKETIRLNYSQVSLHVNTENKGAISLYLKCGMRCINYIPGFYLGDSTYTTPNAFMMILHLKNVKNSSTVCLFPCAVEISLQEEAFYEQTCSQASVG